MNIISLKVVPLLDQGKMSTSAESQTYTDANLKRVDTLLHAIEAGHAYYQLKQMFSSSIEKDTVYRTEVGDYTGWLDFLKKRGFNRDTINNYIFMYEHRREYAELKLISKDPEDIASGAAGHRKIASIKAVKWYLQKIAEEGEHIRGTLTACDYQAEVQSNHKKVKQQKYVPIAEYNKLKLEYNLLKQELDELKAKQLQLG